MKQIKVLLIGFGKMGNGLGVNDKQSHFGALNSLKKKFVINSIVDKKFTKKRGFYSSNIINALKNKPELVVISVSSKNHFNVITKILKNKFCPKVLFLEKPSFQNMNEFNKVEKIINRKKNTKIIINQTYRFDKNLNKFKKYIKTNSLGKLHKVSINYTNGLKNNGIHLIDAFYYLFPIDFNFRVIWSNLNPLDNFSKNKLNYDFCLYDKKKKILFEGQSFNNKIFEIFELIFYFSNCRVVISDYFKDFIVQKIKYDRFKNKEIGIGKNIFKKSSNFPLINAYNKIYDYFKYNKIEKKFEIFENKKILKIINKIEDNEKN